MGSILEWHRSNYRDYPWRHELSPYKIMIAKFMLQRTKADQVVAVYHKFLKKYPNINCLANSNLEDIKNILKPLGLSWRATHFKKAAEYILKENSGIIPHNKEEELLKIPGVGEYVAGAIMAIVFKKPTSIVDSNIARVINKYYGLDLKGEIRRKKTIVELSEELFSHNEPGKVLFALIDFSAIICTPSNPDHQALSIK